MEGQARTLEIARCTETWHDNQDEQQDNQLNFISFSSKAQCFLLSPVCVLLSVLLSLRETWYNSSFSLQ